MCALRVTADDALGTHFGFWSKDRVVAFHLKHNLAEEFTMFSKARTILEDKYGTRQFWGGNM